MNDCVFCRIARREFGLVIYEDEFTISFMDTAMDVDGHILVIPKKHEQSMLDCDEETALHVMRAVKKVSDHLVVHCGYDGVNLLSACGEAAGQSLGHFHIHLIPRRHDDGLGGTGAWPTFPGAKEDIMDVYKRLVVK